MATRNATAQWNGGLKDGNGRMALGTGTFEAPFTFQSRFESGPETNPEELIGAALAGCYSMQLSSMLEKDGAHPESVRTEARVSLRRGDEGPYIDRIELTTRARVPDVDQAAFDQTAAAAKQACLVQRALAGVGEITVEATLEG